MKCCVAVIAIGLAVLTVSANDWAKGYGNVDPEEIDEYLDDTFFALKTNASSLNVDPMNLPNTSFTVRLSDKELVIIEVEATNQVLTRMASLKRSGVGKIDNHKMASNFIVKDLVINGQLSLLGGTYNQTCTLFVDIEELSGHVELGLPENKTESLSVASLRVLSPIKPTAQLEKGCVKDGDTENHISEAFKKELDEDFGNTIRILLKEALNKTLKPFDPVSGH